MSIPEAVLELENRSIGQAGEPTLAHAYDLLLAEWHRGCRDREVGLHLIFLAWYLLCEPAHLTGLSECESVESTLTKVFGEVHDYFVPSIRGDAEMLYVVGLMAHLFPYLLGEEAEFTKLSQKYRERYRSLAPDGIPSDMFASRGAYGDYFSQQAQVSGGY
jgi:hypothetical protein